MRFLSKLFAASDRLEGPEISFGRYTDLYKPGDKEAARRRARELFSQRRFLESFEAFFDFLTNTDEQNVRTFVDGDELRFEILQGSKLIRGNIGNEMIHAEAKVAHAHTLPLGFMRRMLELNYMLKYSRYALDGDGNLTILFDSYLLDGSPTKTYHALKETAVSADKQDDLLVAEFEGIEAINTGHIRQIPQAEKHVKTTFLKSRIAAVCGFIDESTDNQEKYEEGVVYLLLDLAYRLDYLISPEGRVKEIFERVHLILFGADDRTVAQKILLARKAFEEILAMPDAAIQGELYRTTSTFGMTAAGSHEQLSASVDGTLGSMDWFAEHQQPEVALAIPGFIAGYGLFNYAYPPPLHDLLHLYFYISEPAFFASLGYSPKLYDPNQGQLDKRNIRGALDQIAGRYRSDYPGLSIDSRGLDFSSLMPFVKSYFTLLTSLDLKKKH